MIIIHINYSFNRSTEEPERTVVIDLTQGAGSTAEAALSLSCMYVGVDMDPLAEQVVQRRIEHLEEHVLPPSILKAKWANQMKWSIFSRENSLSTIAEIEDGQDGIYLLILITIILLILVFRILLWFREQ